MTKRKATPLPESQRTRPEETPALIAYGYQIRSRSLSFENDILRVHLKFPENHSTGDVKIDFARAYLPPNRLHSTVTLLKDRTDLAQVVVAVIDTHLLRQQESKSTAQNAVNVGRTVIRALEYFWLHDIYHLKWVTRAHWDTLLNKFVEGGWFFALELEKRASAIDLRTLPLSRRKKKQGTVEYSCDRLLAEMGANVVSGQVRLEYRRGDTTGHLQSSREEASPGVASITALASHLNSLVDLPREIRASCLAHPNPYLFAESAAETAQNRTENFDPAQLASLLCEAYRWVSIYSKPIIQLASHVYSELTPYQQEEVVETRLLRVLESPEARTLQEMLGTRIATVARIGDWQRGLGVLGLMRTLDAACFLLLGVFNGRRKDEIASKATGVYADAFECIDEGMALYQSYFYCEKTDHDYRQFYINEISFKALTTAKALADVSWKEVARNGGQPQEGRMRKIFCMPPRARETTPSWYDYSSDPGIALLCQRAGSTVAPNAHMFRRAYAVVFQYRYENEDLYALSQQLRHRDLGMTVHYVTEGPSRVLAHHAAKLWGDGGASKKARAAQAAELAAEVKDYSRVKLHDDVLELLRGGRSIAGGFPRLVQRFTRKMLGRISYDDADLRTAARTVSKVLIDRGHSSLSFQHGNCNAGRPKPSARCYKAGQLSRDKASPELCGGCAYHQMKRSHLRAVEDDLAWQREDLAKRPNSLCTRSEKLALKATEALISFYRRGADLQKEAPGLGK